MTGQSKPIASTAASAGVAKPREDDQYWDKIPRTPSDILRHAIKGAIRK
jgi:hypothetical protein